MLVRRAAEAVRGKKVVIQHPTPPAPRGCPYRFFVSQPQHALLLYALVLLTDSPLHRKTFDIYLTRMALESPGVFRFTGLLCPGKQKATEKEKHASAQE